MHICDPSAREAEVLRVGRSGAQEMAQQDEAFAIMTRVQALEPTMEENKMSELSSGILVHMTYEGRRRGW